MIENMSDNIKLEVAVEIMASKIAQMIRKGYTIDDEVMQQLLEEKKQMYKCNMNVINKIINVYGKELKQKFSKEGN